MPYGRVVDMLEMKSGSGRPEAIYGLYDLLVHGFLPLYFGCIFTGIPHTFPQVSYGDQVKVKEPL